MSQPDPDALMERALEIALSRPEGWRSIPAELALASPRMAALDLVAALARAAVALEETFEGEARGGLAARLHRLASLTALDAWTLARERPRRRGGRRDRGLPPPLRRRGPPGGRRRLRAPQPPRRARIARP